MLDRFCHSVPAKLVIQYIDLLAWGRTTSEEAEARITWACCSVCGCEWRLHCCGLPRRWYQAIQSWYRCGYLLAMYKINSFFLSSLQTERKRCWCWSNSEGSDFWLLILFVVFVAIFYWCDNFPFSLQSQVKWLRAQRSLMSLFCAWCGSVWTLTRLNQSCC